MGHPAVMVSTRVDGIVEPVPRDLQRLLRRAVLDHTTTERQRVFPPALHVGVPGAVRARFVVGPDDGTLDHAVRTDVVEAMVRRTRRPDAHPIVWLTRRGQLDLQDVDLDWLAAARTAGAELGIPLPLVVVNRRSWRDPRTGVGRQWERLRS